MLSSMTCLHDFITGYKKKVRWRVLWGSADRVTLDSYVYRWWCDGDAIVWSTLRGCVIWLKSYVWREPLIFVPKSKNEIPDPSVLLQTMHTFRPNEKSRRDASGKVFKYQKGGGTRKGGGGRASQPQPDATGAIWKITEMILIWNNHIFPICQYCKAPP